MAGATPRSPEFESAFLHVQERILKSLQFEHAFRGNLSLNDTAEMPDLGFHFVPLALDPLGAPSVRVATTVKCYALQVSMPSASMTATVATWIWQKLSLAMWSSLAAAILAPMPL